MTFFVAPKKSLTEMLNRRQLLKQTAALIAFSELTGLPVHAETTFTFGNIGGSWGDGMTKAFSDDGRFAQKTKQTVQQLNAPYPVLISRLLAQPNNPPYSVADLLDVEHYMAADAGAIQDYDLGIVKNYKDIYPTATQPARNGLKNWCASFTMPLVSLTYNTKHVPRPTKWEDMWSAKYKGRIAIPDFGWYGQTWLHAVNKQLGGTETNISPGITAIAELVRKNDAIVLKTTEQAIKAFQTEQILIMPYWNGRAALLQEAGVPVEMAYVPGTIQLHNGLVIAKGTPFREAANEFVNNALTGELQLHLTRMFKYPPSNKTVKLPPDLAKYATPANALDAVVPLDWAKINEQRVMALDRWNKEVLG
jgi:putative spermidine/putrescine transport system substrate-binding protein